jgi:heme O synthase-like polyprenyltransferase
MISKKSYNTKPMVILHFSTVSTFWLKPTVGAEGLSRPRELSSPQSMAHSHTISYISLFLCYHSDSTHANLRFETCDSGVVRTRRRPIPPTQKMARSCLKLAMVISLKSIFSVTPISWVLAIFYRTDY